MTRPGIAALTLIILAIAAPFATRADAAGTSTYLSLGDSTAFGAISTPPTPGLGDQGFVRTFADDLGHMAAGVRPAVVNAAVPFESLNTFFSGNPYNNANTNYSSPQVSQNTLFVQTVAAQMAAGRSIDQVSISLGTMDVMNLLNSTGFAALPLDQQAVKLGQTLGQIQGEYANVLGEVHALLPNAKISLIGAFNPFHALPNDPIVPIAEPAFLGLNKIIQGAAKGLGANYIDTYTAFLGHEATYTHVLDRPGDINLTAAGFTSVAAELNAAAVPEPGTLALGCLGVLGLVARARTLRRRGVDAASAG